MTSTPFVLLLSCREASAKGLATSSLRILSGGAMQVLASPLTTWRCASPEKLKELENCLGGSEL